MAARLGSRVKSFSLVTWLAVALVAIAALALVIGITTSRLDNWMPNIATEALAIGVTIAVVERIVERERRRRVQPRVDRALGVLSSDYVKFARMAQFDYASTHLSSDLTEVPEDPLAMLKFWQERHGTETSSRSLPGRRPLLLEEGITLVRKAQRIAEADRELLPSDLVIAIDNLSQTFGGRGDLFLDMVEDNYLPPSQGLDNWLCLVMVENARHLGEALRRHGVV